MYIFADVRIWKYLVGGQKRPFILRSLACSSMQTSQYVRAVEKLHFTSEAHAWMRAYPRRSISVEYSRGIVSQ